MCSPDGHPIMSRSQWLVRGSRIVWLTIFLLFWRCDTLRTTARYTEILCSQRERVSFLVLITLTAFLLNGLKTCISYIWKSFKSQYLYLLGRYKRKSKLFYLNPKASSYIFLLIQVSKLSDVVKKNFSNEKLMKDF